MLRWLREDPVRAFWAVGLLAVGVLIVGLTARAEREARERRAVIARELVRRDSAEAAAATEARAEATARRSAERAALREECEAERAGDDRFRCNYAGVKELNVARSSELCSDQDLERIIEAIDVQLELDVVSFERGRVYAAPVLWAMLPDVEAKRRWITYAGIYHACVWRPNNVEGGEQGEYPHINVYDKASGREIASWGAFRGFTFR